jgi:hypothetical protein
MENTIEKLIGSPRESVIGTLGKPENNSNSEIVYLMQLLSSVFTKKGYTCSLIMST